MANSKRKAQVELNFEQAVDFVKSCLKGNRTPYLEGQPGVGKTTVASEIVKDESFGFESFIIITPTMHNALDLRGFGYTADILDSKGNFLGKETRFAQSTVLPAEGKHLVVVDELPDCPIHEQSGFYQILLEGRIGEYALPKGSMVMGCGNAPEHRAAANDLSSAIRGRVATAILKPDMKCLYRHALRDKWAPVTIAFFKHYPKCLFGFDADDFAGGCTPRDLEAVSRIELAGWPKNPVVSHATALGNLGNNWGDKYYAHREISIPDPDDVIKRPTEAPIPEEPEIMYAYSAAVAQRADKDNISQIRKYSRRLAKASPGRAAEVGLMYDCLVANMDEIVETDTWIEFYNKNDSKIL